MDPRRDSAAEPVRGTGTLQVSTPSSREIVMTRVFNAPRRMVFDAMTKPELVKRWMLGPDGWSMPICEIDLRVGGTYRYVWRNTKGKEMGMSGVFREIVPPERIVQTEKFDDAWYPGEAVDIVVLTEQNGRTTMTATVLCDSQEARDIMLKTGMTEGASMSYDRLAELVESAE